MGCCPQLNCRTSYWTIRRNVNNDFDPWKSRPDDMYWRNQIRVATDDNEFFSVLLIGIVNQVNRNVDIGSLFFRCLVSTVAVKRAWSNATKRSFAFEFSKDDRYKRKGVKGQQVRRLTLARTSINRSRKVFDACKIIVRKQSSEVTLEIQPFVRCAFDCSVVQVEPDNVDNRFHGGRLGPDIKKGQSYRLAKPAKSRGVVTENITLLSFRRQSLTICSGNWFGIPPVFWQKMRFFCLIGVGIA
jgi:hypothetical protein